MLVVPKVRPPLIITEYLFVTTPYIKHLNKNQPYSASAVLTSTQCLQRPSVCTRSSVTTYPTSRDRQTVLSDAAAAPMVLGTAEERLAQQVHFARMSVEAEED